MAISFLLVCRYSSGGWIGKAAGAVSAGEGVKKFCAVASRHIV